MINLLPPQYAMRIRFGRANTMLRRWIIGSLVAIAGLLVIIAGGWLYLNQQSADLQASLDTTNAELQSQNLEKVQKDASEITGDIKAITQVLNSEIKFSALIQDIGKTMPPGAVLTGLSIGKANGPLDLVTNARNSTTAAQVAVNLADTKTGMFSKVDIIQVSCETHSAQDGYGCAGSYRVLFSADAQKKYINVPSLDTKKI